MNDLDTFLQAAKSRGATDEFLVALLKEHGWPASSIYQALGRHYAESTGIPIPASRGRMESAREAFFHLLAFATLGTWICATGSLWFELIDLWFPDAAYGYRGYWGWSRISWQMSSLIVAFPAFVIATRAILREMDENPDKASSAVRRWLTNIALLIAALVAIGDLVTFVAALLQGELTVRFVLRCLVVFVLAGAVFLYYVRGLGKSAVAPRNWHRGFAAAAAAAILLSLGAGFMRSGSPSDQRLRMRDQRRTSDLHRIATRLHYHWTRQSEAAGRKLPATLQEMHTGPEAGMTTHDPFNGIAYEYTVTGEKSYSLCAVFETETPKLPNQPAPAWSHEPGRMCFEMDVTKSPPYPGVDTY